MISKFSSICAAFMAYARTKTFLLAGGFSVPIKLYLLKNRKLIEKCFILLHKKVSFAANGKYHTFSMTWLHIWWYWLVISYRDRLMISLIL